MKFLAILKDSFREAVDAKELHAGAAAMATLAYLLAEKGL